MPYDHDLSKKLKKAGWKIKIHDLERLEDPHITIYRKREKWRLSLRSGNFLDPGDKWSQIDDEVREEIEDGDVWQSLCDEWDRIHPDNPVEGDDDDNEDDEAK